MKYILTVLLFCLVVPGTVFASGIFPNGGVSIMHSNCTETDYASASNSDISRGTALKNAVTASVAGDTLYLSASTFDIGNAGITLPTSVSLYGRGIDTTIIKSQVLGGIGGAIVVPGTSSVIGYLTVNGNEGFHNLQLPVGFYQGINTIPTNFTVENVKLIAESDGFYFYSTSTTFTANIFNSTVNSKFDSIALDSSGSTVNVYDSTFISAGPYFLPIMGTAGSVRGSGGTLNLYNSNFTATNNNTNYALLSLYGTMNAYHCMENSSGGVGHYDLREDGGIFNIANNNIYSTTSGVINTVSNITISTPSLPSETCQNPFTTDATLSNFTISSGTLTPVFSPSTTSYTASVANRVTSLTVTPTTNQANATVTVNGTLVASGNASGAITLNVGSNTITTVVTAQDGITTNTYTIIVTRAPGGGATSYPISVYVTPNGSISPGSQNIVQGGNYTFNITPNTGYQIADVLVDNVSVGVESTHTFSSITQPHTILANFSTVPTSINIVVPTVKSGTATIIELKKQLIALITQVLQLLQAKFLVLTHK